MVAPVIIIGGSIVANVAVGYAVDHYFGDSDYSKRELATDVTLGLIPGLGLIRPGVKIGRGLVKVGRAYRKGDTASDVALVSGYIVASESTPIVKTLVAGQVVSAMYDRNFSFAFDPVAASRGAVLPAAGGSGAAASVSAKSKSYRPKYAGKCRKGFYYNKRSKMCVPYKPNRK